VVKIAAESFAALVILAMQCDSASQQGGLNYGHFRVGPRAHSVHFPILHVKLYGYGYFVCETKAGFIFIYFIPQ
jgi:hypothetical protein